MPNPIDLVDLEPPARLRQLSDLASSFEVDDNVPPRRYFRSGMEMIRMADVYLDEKNYENAFILYSKFITLFVEKLPQHQDYKSATPKQKAEAKKDLNEVFPKAEKLKKHLKKIYAEDYERYLAEKIRREERLAKEQEEIRRRIKEEEEERRKRQSGQSEQQLKIQADLEKWKISGPPNENDAVDRERLVPSKIDDKELFEWPDWDTQSTDDGCPQSNNRGASMPLVPSRELKPVVNAGSDYGSIPMIDRSTKPPALLGPSSNSTSSTSWSSVRNITVPSILMSEFLALAQKNTDRNVETCGILTGKLAQHRFTITHLLVPKQVGTPDSCSTDNEEEIFEFQDQHDLITLGWIHTHPSQTSFMSSVDLHTHCAYQLMLPEAIAIVCSPKYNETGIYSLTNDYGLNFIAKCQQTGFHPHPKEPPLYIDSDHVIVDNTAKISVQDLR